MQLQYKPNIDDDVLTSYCDIMVEGNTILRDYHSRLKSKYPSRAVFRGAIFRKVDRGEPVQFGPVAICEADLAKILAVRSIEVDVIEAFMGVVYNQAKIWHTEGSSCTMDDLIQEGLATLLDSLYYYTNSRIKFITFATGSIKNRMITSTNIGELIALPDSDKNRDLLRRYDEASRELSELGANFDTVCNHMGVSDSQRDHLRDLRAASATSQSDVESSGGRDNRIIGDFTAIARPIPVAPRQGRPGYYRHSNGDDDLGVSANMEMLLAVRQLIVDASRLPEFDRAVLFAALDGERGWQTKVASQFTNKVSGKPYSRASVKWAMERLGNEIEAIVHQDAALASDVA